MSFCSYSSQESTLATWVLFSLANDGLGLREPSHSKPLSHSCSARQLFRTSCCHTFLSYSHFCAT